MRLTSSRAYARPAPVPKMPSGLVELMEGLTKEVLRNNPSNVYGFCASHMEKLLEIRDGPSQRKPLTLEQKIVKAQEKVRQRAKERREKFDKEFKIEVKDESNDGGPKSLPNIDTENLLTYGNTIIPGLKAPIHHEYDLAQASEIEISHIKQADKSLSSTILQAEEIFGAKENEQAKKSDNLKELKDAGENYDMTVVKSVDGALTEISECPPILNKTESSETGVEIIRDNAVTEISTKAIELIDDYENKGLVQITQLDEKTENKESVSFDESHFIDVQNLATGSPAKNKIEVKEMLNDISESPVEKVTIHVEDAETSNDDKKHHNSVLDNSLSDSLKNIDVVEKYNGKMMANDISNQGVLVNFVPADCTSSVINNDNGSEDKKYARIMDNKSRDSDEILDEQNNVGSVSDAVNLQDNTSNTSPNSADNANEASSLSINMNNELSDVKDYKNKNIQDVTDNNYHNLKTDENPISLSEEHIDVSALSYDIVKDANDESVDVVESSELDIYTVVTNQTLIDKIKIDGEPFQSLENADVIDVTDEKHNVNSEKAPHGKSDGNAEVDLITGEPESSNIYNDSTQINSNNMDLETAAITIQKVFRSFMFKSRNSTFEESAQDEHNSLDEDIDKKDEYYAATSMNMNKERRPLGITRMDTVLQTVNEEKSLSLSTDDSSTLSSAATTIQAHVRGFLARNRLNSNKTVSSNSLVNSNEALENESEQQKDKTILNIHIVPEESNYLSRDESLITSMDLSLDGSPPSSINLHPLSYDISERRKMLKREDAIQSISPPSNNSGKLSEESVKEILLHDNDTLESETAEDKNKSEEDHSNDVDNDTSDLISDSTATPITVINVCKSEELDMSLKEPDDILQHHGPSATKTSSDEADVIMPHVPSPRSEYQSGPKLEHSGECHDVLLPTKVSRNDTSVVRGE